MRTIFFRSGIIDTRLRTRYHCISQGIVGYKEK
nr:MAG TPA: hypothetical protein [Caudoviricetes sp.]